MLFATSGDGTLCVMDIRKDTLFAQSIVPQDDEYSCLEFCCQNRIVF